MKFSPELRKIIEKSVLSFSTVSTGGAPHTIYVACVKVLNGKVIITDNFMKEEVLFLQNLLQKTLDIKFNITRKNSMKNIDKGYYLYIDHRDNIIKFVNYIKDVMPISMSRKSDRWKELL